MSDYSELIALAIQLKKDFLETADDLDRHLRNVSIARIFGSSTAIVGGAGAVGFGIAAFFTLGITVPLAIASAVVATAGGLTAGGASIALSVISQTRMRRMHESWERFKELYDTALIDMDESHATVGQKVSQAAAAARLISDAVQAIRGTAAMAGAEVAGGAASAAVAPARVVAALTSPMVIVNVVLLGLSVYDLVDASLEIHRKNRSPAGDTLRGFANELDVIIQKLSR